MTYYALLEASVPYVCLICMPYMYTLLELRGRRLLVRRILHANLLELRLLRAKFTTSYALLKYCTKILYGAFCMPT